MKSDSPLGAREASDPEERLRLLLDGLADACLCMLDAKGRITGIAGTLGDAHVPSRAGSLLGAPLARLYGAEEVAAGEPERDLAAAARERRHESQGWRRNLAGETIWAHAVITALPGGDGRAGAYAVVLRDLSERRRAERALQESEARYRAVSELTSDYAYAFRIDPDGRVVVEWVTGAFARITGYSLDEMQELQSVGGGLSIIHPDDQPIALARVQRLVLGRADTSEFRIVTKGGEIRWIRESGRPQRDGSGVLRIFGAAQDITERKLAEEEARARQAELAHVLRLGTMGEMAAGLAHEISQPLSAIVSYARGCTRRLRSGRLDAADLLQPIEEVAAQAMRANEIVQRLLLFVRKQKPARERIAANDLAREVINLIVGEARERGAKLELQLASGLPVVEVDKIQIEQVILNLARNGLEAMQTVPPEERTLVIRTSATGDGCVEFTVADRGEGLAADAVARVFEPFFTTKRSGLGMGLAISRSIVRGHGGRIAARANDGRGATFSFTLPGASGP